MALDTNGEKANKKGNRPVTQVDLNFGEVQITEHLETTGFSKTKGRLKTSENPENEDSLKPLVRGKRKVHPPVKDTATGPATYRPGPPTGRPSKFYITGDSERDTFDQHYWKIPGFPLGDRTVDLVQEKQPPEGARTVRCVLEMSGDEAENRLKQMRQLEHENVLRVLGCFYFGGSYKVVVQLVELCLDDIGTVCHVHQVLRERHFAIIFRQVQLGHLHSLYRR